MPRVDANYKRQRRSEILDAAARSFARSGFHRTTLQDVFAESGLSAGCVYNYFQSKDALILAIARERHALERELIETAQSAGDAKQALQLIGRRFVDYYLKDDGDLRRRIALQTWAEAQHNKKVLASVVQGVDGPQRQLASLIRRGQASRQLNRALDADALARSLIALLHGVLLQKLWNPALEISAQLTVYEHFVDSLALPAPSARKRRRA